MVNGEAGDLFHEVPPNSKAFHAGTVQMYAQLSIINCSPSRKEVKGFLHFCERQKNPYKTKKAEISENPSKQSLHSFLQQRDFPALRQL
jgi:hypothetical protein